MKIRKLREIDYDTVSQFMAELHKLHAESRPDMYRQVEEIGTVYTKEEFYSMLQNDEMITLGADTEEGELMGICIATIRETKHPIMVRKRRCTLKIFMYRSNIESRESESVYIRQ